MEYVRLGKTDILVSRIAFGAMRLSNALGQDNAASIVRKAYDSGINFFDTTSKIPESEKLLGDALYDIRRNVFLSTTTAALTAKEIKDNIEESLMSLHCDTVDLYQFETEKFLPKLDFSENELYTLLKRGDADMEYLSIQTGKSVVELSMTLMQLELKGVVVRLPGNRYSIKQ